MTIIIYGTLGIGQRIIHYAYVLYMNGFWKEHDNDRDWRISVSQIVTSKEFILAFIS